VSGLWLVMGGTSVAMRHLSRPVRVRWWASPPCPAVAAWSPSRWRPPNPSPARPVNPVAPAAPR